MTEPLRWYIADRQQGKTEDLITWVKGGVPTDSYPGWSRIILVSSLQEADLLRGGDPATNKYGLEYRQVFAFIEWNNAKLGTGPVEIGIDNIEFFLERMLAGGRSRITRITGTGDITAWPEVEARRLEEDK